jgi:hypothetical protein
MVILGVLMNWNLINFKKNCPLVDRMAKVTELIKLLTKNDEKGLGSIN